MSISKEADDILRKARKLIENPKKWTQKTLARDQNGNEISVQDDRACSRCALGAVCFASKGSIVYWEVVSNLEMAARKLFGTSSIVDVNDRRTHADVLLMFSAARWQ